MSRRYRYITVAAILASCIGLPRALAEEWSLIHNGFLTGNQFLNAGDSTKRGYLMGFIDGLLVSPFVGAPKEKIVWLERCLDGMNDRQIVAIFDTWLTKNPAHWHEPAHALAFRAFREACQN